MDISKIQTGLHSRLSSRRIHYDMYSFHNESVMIVAYIQGPKGSMSRPYTISSNEDGTMNMSTYSAQTEVKSESTAISLIVGDLRAQMAKFKQYLQ